MIDAGNIIEAVTNGERIASLSKKMQVSVSALRWRLKKEGVEYREILQKAKAKRNTQLFERCLNAARKKKRLLTISEFERMGVSYHKAWRYKKKLKAIGFESKAD